MIKTAKTSAHTLVVAALASALTLGVTAAPAFAQPVGCATAPIVVAQSNVISPSFAVDIARAYYNVDFDHVDAVDCELVTYDNHLCYEVRFHEGEWWNPELGWWCGDHNYVVYVGAVISEIYGAYDF